MRPNQQFIFTLASNPTTGASWRMLTEPGIEILDVEYIAPPEGPIPVAGRGGKMRWVMRVAPEVDPSTERELWVVGFHAQMWGVQTLHDMRPSYALKIELERPPVTSFSSSNSF
jgi:predicted secreted protein